MRYAVLGVALFAAALSAQTKAPELTDLEACQVDVSLLNEHIVQLKVELAELQKRYDVVQLQLDRARRTPPAKEGHVWSWDRDANGVLKGYVKAEEKK